MNRVVELLFLSSSTHVLVGLQYVQSASRRMIRGMKTHVGIEEERVRSPGEGFGADVQVIVAGREGEVAVVLSHEVLLMFSMFTLNLLHPEVARYDCFSRLVQI